MFGALGPLRRSKTQRLLLFSESRLLALRQTTSEGCAYAGCTQGAAFTLHVLLATGFTPSLCVF